MSFKLSMTLQSEELKYSNWGVLLYILVDSTGFYNHLKFENLLQQLFFFIMTNSNL